MTSSRTPPAPRYRRDGGSLGETVAAATSSARETAGSVRASAREAISTIRGTTGQLADRSEAGARRVRDGYAHLRDEQPLVLGALAVAAGAAIGAVLPRSATEDAWLGAKSDAVTARLQSEARARLEDAKADGASAIMGATDDGGESPAPGSF
jgi:cell division septum initiation protein DivIVA